jgi:hypothetical protein
MLSHTTLYDTIEPIYFLHDAYYFGCKEVEVVNTYTHYIYINYGIDDLKEGHTGFKNGNAP